MITADQHQIIEKYVNPDYFNVDKLSECYLDIPFSVSDYIHEGGNDNVIHTRDEPRWHPLLSDQGG